MARRKKNLSWYRKLSRIWIITILVGLVMVILLALELTNTTHIFHSSAPKTAAIKTTTASSDDDKSKPSPSSQSSDDSKVAPTDNSATDNKASSTGSSTPPATGVAPAIPYGNFVSNHSPGAGGSPTTETSACLTTVGASCTIVFTNGDLTRTLSAQTTDSNGATTWNWDASAFPKGSWHITATATLNGQSKSTTDTKTLDIQ